MASSSAADVAMPEAAPASRTEALQALVRGEERAGRLRALLADQEAQNMVLRRKLRLEAAREWSHLPESPEPAHQRRGGGGGRAVGEKGVGQRGQGDQVGEGQAVLDGGGVVPGGLVEGGGGEGHGAGHGGGEGGGGEGHGVVLGGMVEGGGGEGGGGDVAPGEAGGAPAAAGGVQEGHGAGVGVQGPEGEALGGDGGAPAAAGGVQEGHGAGVGVQGPAGEALGHGGAAARSRRKRARAMSWPEGWVRVPYKKWGVRKPAGVCLGCWWTFQEYDGWRPHDPALCLFEQGGA